MSDKRYFVMVDGRKLGPFDKRTITGMRVKHVLTSDQKVYDDNGLISTVQELVASATNPGRFEVSSSLGTGAIYPKFVVRFLKPPADIYGGEAFEGEGELRVQPDVLRVAGMVRSSIWAKAREHRVKIPREHISRIKQTDNLVALQADALPNWPQQGVLSFAFFDEQEAQTFCEIMQGPSNSPASITPDVLL